MSTLLSPVVDSQSSSHLTCGQPWTQWVTLSSWEHLLPGLHECPPVLPASSAAPQPPPPTRASWGAGTPSVLPLHSALSELIRGNCDSPLCTPLPRTLCLQRSVCGPVPPDPHPGRPGCCGPGVSPLWQQAVCLAEILTFPGSLLGFGIEKNAMAHRKRAWLLSPAPACATLAVGSAPQNSLLWATLLLVGVGEGASSILVQQGEGETLALLLSSPLSCRALCPDRTPTGAHPSLRLLIAFLNSPDRPFWAIICPLSCSPGRSQLPQPLPSGSSQPTKDV